VCFPSLSFKDRVVGHGACRGAAISALRRLVARPRETWPTRVAAQGAQQGFDTCVFIPADLEPAKKS